MVNRAIVTGNFDGLHLGHQHLLNELKLLAAERGLKPCVLSFEPHTAIVTRKANEPFLITTSLEKRHLLERRFGIESLLLPFSEEFMKMESTQYLEDILFKKYGAKLWLHGFDHKFGKGARGRDQELDSRAHALGVEIVQSHAIYDGPEPVSSTRIRDCLKTGDIELANELLGNPFIIQGEVHKGDQIGRTIGFPTANLHINPWKLLPAHGVYGAKVEIEGREHIAAVHIGPRPSMNAQEIRVEAHILDFNEDIYCQNLKLELIFRVRTIMPFNSPEKLISQIEKDVKEIRAKLGN